MKYQNRVFSLLALFSVFVHFSCQKHEFRNPVDPEISLTAPTNVRALEITETLVTLAWDDANFSDDFPNSAPSFEIEKSADGVHFSRVALSTRNAKTAGIAGVYSTDSTYLFRVRTLEGSKASAYSPALTVKITFPGPSNVTVASITEASVTLQWQDNSSIESSFEIEQSTDGTSWTPIGTAAANATSTMIARSFMANTAYTFRVRAKSQANASAYAASQKAAPILAPSNPSPALNANGIATTVMLTWSCSDLINTSLTYDVYLGTSNPPVTVLASNLSATSVQFTGAAEMTTYFWKVVAKDGKGASKSSPVWSFTTASAATLPGMITVQGGAMTLGSSFIAISTFTIDKFEVTYDLWTEVRTWGLSHGYTDLPAGTDGRNPVGTSNPVANVNWYDAVKWCNARSEKAGLAPVYYTSSAMTTVYRTGKIDINTSSVNWSASGFRLPTEAEWEYAARGGTQSVGYIYSGSNNGNDVAWFDNNSNSSTHTVGQKGANELGICDMSGNIEEWCWDWQTSAYPSGGTSDPRGPSSTQTYRIVRGGSYNSFENETAVNVRFYKKPDLDFSYVMDGFRCVKR